MKMHLLKWLFVLFSALSLKEICLARINIVTTTEDLAAIAREVGGDRVEAVSLARGYQDPHFVDAKPSYLIKLQKADLFIEIGRDLEVGWAPALLNSARNPRILPGSAGFLDASANVPILEIPAGQVSRAQGDVHPFGNPHFWLDPRNGEPVAEAVAEKLSSLSPADAQGFRDRARDFKERLEKRLSLWEGEAKRLGLPGMKVVTYHRSWSYFAKRFGLEVVDFVEPKPGIPPAPQHIENLVRRIGSEGVRLIIVDPYFDVKLPQKLAQRSGAKLVVLPTSTGAEKGIASYFDLFDRQLQLLAEALSKGGE